MTSTFPSTLADLRKRVRRRLLTKEDGTAGDHWSDESIKDAINYYQRIVYEELVQSFETYYFTKILEQLTPTNNRIELPTDWKRTLLLEKQIGTGGEYVPVTIVSATRYQEFQAPIYPNTDQSISALSETWSEFPGYLRALGSWEYDGTYRLTYFHNVEDLQADNIETQIPESYQDLMVIGAAAQLAQDAGQDDRAAHLRANFERDMDRMRRSAGNLNLSKSLTIRDVRRYGFGRW